MALPVVPGAILSRDSNNPRGRPGLRQSHRRAHGLQRGLCPFSYGYSYGYRYGCQSTRYREKACAANSTVTRYRSRHSKDLRTKQEMSSMHTHGVIAPFQRCGGPKPPAFNATVATSVSLDSGLSGFGALEVTTDACELSARD